jgi:hypothetical protein
MHRLKSHPLLAVALGSMALLGFEMLLIRFASILLYPLAAYLVISVGLLGYGLSGTLLALVPPRRLSLRLAGMGLAGFGIAVLGCMLWVWFAWESPLLAATLPVAAALSFACGGLAIATVLENPHTAVSRVYFADLLGASAGAALTLLGLNFLSGVQLGVVLAGLGLLAAAALFSHRLGRLLCAGAAVGMLACAWLIPLPRGILPLVPKELARFVDLGAGVDWEYQAWGALARIDVLSLPGDSLIPAAEPVDYKLVTQDGGAPTLLISPQNDALQLLGETTNFGVPYWLKPDPARVLIIGLGGGPDLQTALYFNAHSVTAAEINPRMLDLLRERYPAYTGYVVFDPRVEILQTDGRHLVRAAEGTYDIIQLTGVDTTVASPGATPNLAENYLYTVEAFREYYGHLSARGLLSVSFPEVEGLSLRLLSTSWRALSQEGVADPAAQILLFRLGGFAHVLMKRAPFTGDEVNSLQARLAGDVRGVYFPLYGRLFGTEFDPASELLLAPGLSLDGEPAALAAALAAGEEQDWMAAQERTIAPATDDRPFFFVLDKWGGYAPNLTALLAALALLALASLGFLVIPLFILGRRGLSVPATLPLALYFILLGMAYIAVEVCLIQRLTFLLGHPSYALATTISALLASSGLGSLWSGRWRATARTKVMVGALGAAACIALTALGLPWLIDRLMWMPFAARLMVAIAIVAVPGFLMGMPFPTGLGEVKRRSEPFVPWAWALNSSATVMGTIAILLVAMTFGFTAVLIAAAAMYLLAGATFALAQRQGLA